MIKVAEYQSYPFDGGAVVAANQSRQLLLLNVAGMEIWEGLKAGLSPAQLADKLASSHGVPRRRAEADVAEYLGMLDAKLNPPGSSIPGAVEPCGTARKVVPLAPLRGIDRVYRVGPSRVRVLYPDHSLYSLVHPVFEHLLDDGACTDCVLRVYQDNGIYRLQMIDGAEVSHRHTASFAQLLIREIFAAAAEVANPLMVIHGAAVASGERCLILPGLSGSGKSTLAAALSASGLTLLSDDVLFIDRATLQVRGVPARLNLKSGSLPVLGTEYGLGEDVFKLSGEWGEVYYLPPSNFDGAVLDRTYSALGILLPRYTAGADISLESVTPSQLLSEMLLSQSTVAAADGEDLRALLNWLEIVPAGKLQYDSLTEAVDLIGQLFEECLI